MSGIVHIMGIVNLTQDSFYAGSRTAATDALSRAQQMWASGATVVDLGACSTRPGAPQPSLEEEWARLEPALREMAGRKADETDNGRGRRERSERSSPGGSCLPSPSTPTGARLCGGRMRSLAHSW